MDAIFSQTPQSADAAVHGLRGRQEVEEGDMRERLRRKGDNAVCVYAWHFPVTHCVRVCYQVERRTLESAPIGPVFLELSNESPRSVKAKWMGPARPHGNMNYTLFYTLTGNTHTHVHTQ